MIYPVMVRQVPHRRVPALMILLCASAAWPDTSSGAQFATDAVSTFSGKAALSPDGEAKVTTKLAGDDNADDFPTSIE